MYWSWRYVSILMKGTDIEDYVTRSKKNSFELF